MEQPFSLAWAKSNSLCPEQNFLCRLMDLFGHLIFSQFIPQVVSPSCFFPFWPPYQVLQQSLPDVTVKEILLRLRGFKGAQWSRNGF